MQWFKWIGMILMGLSVGSVGFWLAYRMEKRLQEYRSLQKILMLLSSRMRIGENFGEAAQSCIEAGAGEWEPWLRKVQEGLQAQKPLSEIWPQALERSKAELHLDKEDYKMLEGLGKSMQGAGLESCLGQISQIQDYFHAQQTMLEQAIQEQGRLYRTIGVLAGILVMVVLM
ncbi:MAG: hypothetical protein HFE64_09800 [Lachnospiraceae bacterium]|jgi:stage III sporulation protein AB|nr:hypothetical protein [Lachnospiraceae bacterium]